MALLEIACFSADDAIVAWNAGADRIELCDERQFGGTTPLLDALMRVKQHVTIPVFIMIRPRGGDFNYSDGEFNQMKADIDAFKPKVNGFVFGILNEGNKVDVRRTAELVRRARPLPCTFHRAFDETHDPLQAFEDVVTSGCHAILSSGGASNAFSGSELLAELVQRAQGRITVMPGGGVRVKNIAQIRALTRATIYHSSGIVNGGDEPEAGEIRRMKMLLRDISLGQLDGIEFTEERKQHTQFERSNGDEEAYGQMHMSAVSIGPNTPMDELDKHL